MGCSVEDFSNRAERLLTSRVPDLQLQEGIFYLDAARSEIDSDSHIMFSIELVLGQSRQNTRLADSYSSGDKN